MEAFSSYSSDSSTYLPPHQGGERYLKVPESYTASLHSVRKSPSKPWKKPIAPLPPTPQRLYKVDPINFRDLVQKLTGAPQNQSSRLQRVAPPNVIVAKSSLYQRDVATSLAKTPLSALYHEFVSEI
ncbi:VQ domain-containing protein [Cephalotus follicularis]|uniref:VQ domain-containing protein n=1 Tax=Cephalotus follicularis TaxID=3775 RepID=A0A1Q3AQ85_CEPFO|nr:VQ domain-containing protein [Cephalotus follicularis]